MKITNFDRKTCQMLASAVEEALKEVAQRFGVNIQRKGGGSFSPTNFTMKIEASVVGQDGTVYSREAENFKLWAKIYNLAPDDLGKSFKSYNGVTYKLVGIATKSHKFPIIAEDERGRRYKLPERMVQQGLGRTVKPYTM